MNKQSLFLSLLFLSTIIQPTAITLINDSLYNILITDHGSYAHMIEPKQSQTFTSQKLATLYLYVQSNGSSIYTLAYRIQEQNMQQEQVTIHYYDIASRKLEKLYPGQFIATHHTRLQIENEQELRKKEIERQRQTHNQGKVEKPSSTTSKHQSSHRQQVADKHHNIMQQGAHQDVLNAIIAEYNQMQAQKHNGIAEDFLKTVTATQHRHSPYRPPTKRS